METTIEGVFKLGDEASVSGLLLPRLFLLVLTGYLVLLPVCSPLRFSSPRIFESIWPLASGKLLQIRFEETKAPPTSPCGSGDWGSSM